MGSYGAEGDRWIAVTSTSAQYPTNGAGGATTTPGSSEAAAWLVTCITEIVITAAANTGSAIICDAAGTALAGWTLPIVATMALPYTVPVNINYAGLGGPSFKIAGASNTFTATYHRVQ